MTPVRPNEASLEEQRDLILFLSMFLNNEVESYTRSQQQVSMVRNTNSFFGTQEVPKPTDVSMMTSRLTSST